MGARSIVPHHHAIDDALDAVDYYRENAGTPIAESFSLAVDEALEQVDHHLKLKKPLPSRWGFCFCGLVT